MVRESREFSRIERMAAKSSTSVLTLEPPLASHISAPGLNIAYEAVANYSRFGCLGSSQSEHLRSHVVHGH
jgi:hypothetical protein